MIWIIWSLSRLHDIYQQRPSRFRSTRYQTRELAVLVSSDRYRCWSPYLAHLMLMRWYHRFYRWNGHRLICCFQCFIISESLRLPSALPFELPPHLTSFPISSSWSHSTWTRTDSHSLQQCVKLTVAVGATTTVSRISPQKMCRCSQSPLSLFLTYHKRAGDPCHSIIPRINKRRSVFAFSSLFFLTYSPFSYQVWWLCTHDANKIKSQE